MSAYGAGDTKTMGVFVSGFVIHMYAVANSEWPGWLTVSHIRRERSLEASIQTERMHTLLSKTR
jgi:hypothetical protein